jgi:regulator of protease activity HflC (stomatin/prohibitin superfamily)
MADMELGGQQTGEGCLGFDTPAQTRRTGTYGCTGLAVVVGLIILGCSIHQLAPEDQVLIYNEQGREVVNGPGTKVLNPFRSKDWRKATKLGPLEYALVENELTGMPRHIEGPTMFFLEAYDVQKAIESKIVLEKDEYVNLVEGTEGTERIIQGPQTIVPTPTETFPKGKEQAVFLDTDSAVLVLDKTTGMQKLVVEQGVFFPGAYQEVVEVRSLIHVFPHEAVVEQDARGQYTVHTGSTAFFLQPYHRLVTMTWSSYSDPIPPEATSQPHKKVTISKIDMRARMMFFTYEVRTSDNVKLRLDGNIFWRVVNVGKMIETSSDPEGEVWQHARSALIQGVSKTTLSVFMARFNNITMEAFATQATDGFYAERGVEIISMEVTRYEPVDKKTAEVLQEIIQETTNRINRLQVQESENDVLAAKLAADIQMEKQKTELIETQSQNQQLQARMQGESGGMKRAMSAKAFIDGLNSSIVNVSKRVELYELHEVLENNRENTQNLASGTANLFLTPKDMKLKLHMGGSGTEL